MPSNLAMKVRVLEVDDDHAVADSLAALLQSLGANVRVAYSGEAALAIIPEFKPDLVLMDIKMPLMDGYETARRIHDLPERKRLVLVALTSLSSDQAGTRITAAGFNRHLVKPVAVGALEQLLGGLNVT
jgi:CheY-like chemotaxis protein